MTIVIQRKEIFKVGAWIKKMELENNSCTFCKTISEMVFLGFSSMYISLSGSLINFSFYKSSPWNHHKTREFCISLKFQTWCRIQ